jgi:membrane AbrB-like protein
MTRRAITAFEGLRGLGWRLIPTYAGAAVAGYAATLVGAPLPWMLGPFLLFAVVSLRGQKVSVIPHGREVAQVTIGFAIGLRFTVPVVTATVALLPQMFAAALYLLVCTTTAAFLFGRLAGVDHVTAFFATAAGGVADMANVAQLRGGEPTSVAVVHALRVSLVVLVAPFIALGASERPEGSLPPYTGNTVALIVALGCAYLAARSLRGTALPNPWLVGPIPVGMVVALAGADMIAVPSAFITAAQIVLGVWLGCQFKRDLLAALPRVTAAGVAVGLLLIGMAVLGAGLLVAITDLPFVTAFLSLAPAAVTEMVLVANFMGLDAETVAAFHVMRIVLVSTTVLWVYRLYLKLGSFADEP